MPQIIITIAVILIGSQLHALVSFLIFFAISKIVKLQNLEMKRAAIIFLLSYFCISLLQSILAILDHFDIEFSSVFSIASLLLAVLLTRVPFRKAVVLFLFTFLISTALYTVLGATVAEPITPTSTAMEPAVKSGRYGFIKKVFNAPQRFDIVTFTSKDAPGEVHLSRILGLPRETVSIVDGSIYVLVNGEMKKIEEAYSVLNDHTVNVPAQTLGEEEYLVVRDVRTLEVANPTTVRKENIYGIFWFQL